MRRRDRLQGHRYRLGAQLEAEVRRSCREELKLVYRAPAFPLEVWQQVAALGRAEVLRASLLHPAMKDLFRVRGEGFLAEGAVGAGELQLLLRGRGRLAARHRVEEVLEANFR